MAGRVTRVKDGFAIRGIAPPALRGASNEAKLTFWSFVTAEALRQKDRELARGLNKDGRPLRPPISAATRKHRRSMMTPTGKGDPSAPPLMPGRGLSRTRSLLAGKAFTDRSELWWRFDAYTYDSWARILRFQADRYPGRDVFGLSPDGVRIVTARSWERFRRWRQGRPGAAGVPGIVQPPAAPAPRIIPTVGTTRMTWAEPGIGARPHRPGAQTTGGMTWSQWLQYLRAPVPAPAGGPRRLFNRLLSFVFRS